MGAPLIYNGNIDLWIGNSTKDYFCDLVVEIAALESKDIRGVYAESGMYAYGVSGLGIKLESFFDYFEGKDNFIKYLKRYRTKLDLVCDSVKVAKNMYHIFSWAIHILNDGNISDETPVYEVLPPEL
jgi:hypothetical protein